MEVELELRIDESDELQVMQKALELVKKAKELGFTIQELEVENEYEEESDGEEEKEEEEYEKEE
jgi:hypothetical protein